MTGLLILAFGVVWAILPPSLDPLIRAKARREEVWLDRHRPGWRD